MNDSTRARIDGLVKDNTVLLFMKGNRQRPQCGFSAQLVQILDTLVPEYRTVDVLADPEIREGIKEYSSWPTIPQLYLAGEFQGGCDIVTEMYQSGELQQKLRTVSS
jgi:monothiol glutaredoxin